MSAAQVIFLFKNLTSRYILYYFVYFIKHICVSSLNNHISVNTRVVYACYLNIYIAENKINITKPVVYNISTLENIAVYYLIIGYKSLSVDTVAVILSIKLRNNKQ